MKLPNPQIGGPHDPSLCRIAVVGGCDRSRHQVTARRRPLLENEGDVVQIVGYVFLALIAVGVLVAIGLTLSSLPDIARYRRIRKM
jgi:hypothetical protein